MAESNGAVVVTSGLTKVFKDFWGRPKVTAVADLDLEIRPKEVFGLLGPNGSGKSTTLKMILGLLFPTKGRIAVFGQRPTDVATKSRIGFLPEESHLYPFLDARETLDFFGRLYHQDRYERNRRVDMLLDMVGLTSVAHRRIGAYSKGMQRKIGLAQALINDPDLLIVDEPTSGMDPIGTKQFKDIIRTLAKGYDGQDRWYLEALGTASTGKESAVYDLLANELGGPDALKWSEAFANIAWRLHVPQATAGLRARALAGTLPVETRKAAIVALAYTGTPDSSRAILDAAQKSGGPVQAEAMWWLLNRKDSLWKEHGINEELKRRGLFDPEKVELVSITVPEPEEPKLTVEAVLKLKGDVGRGQQLATACLMCHKIQDQGVEFGPDLTMFARMQPADVVVRSITHPSADIAHGYQGEVVTTKDDLIIHGIVLSSGDPTIVSSQGGIVQMVPRAQVKSRAPLNRSLMLGAEQMGLGAQEVADLLAYMRSLK